MAVVEANNPPLQSDATFVVAAAAPPAQFHIDDAVFERWCAARDDISGSDDSPDWVEYGAGAKLAELFREAWGAGVIVGDPGIDLGVYGDDDEEVSGFYVILANRAGAQRSLGLTSGWQEVLHLDDVSAKESARACLAEICAIANFTLNQLRVPPALTRAR